MSNLSMDRIGRYEILGELGRGAMGIVFKAQDPTIGRVVAIKTIRLNAFSDPNEQAELRRRLYREAQSAGLLSHPGIVTIYDISEENGNAYIFMEFVNGPTLESLLAAEHAPLPQTVLNLLRQVAVALDHAHRKGIVHRDIKPANIMIQEGNLAKITDFGVARIQSHQMTTGGIIGTPNYMSPEQISGGAIDGRADQFSLAVIVYELLTGERPFAAETLTTLLFKIVQQQPVPPHRINPTLAVEVAAVLGRAMAKKPEERYPDCLSFINELEVACNRRNWQLMRPGTAGSQATVGLTPQTPPPPPPTTVDPPPPIQPSAQAVKELLVDESRPNRKERPSLAKAILTTVGLFAFAALCIYLVRPYLLPEKVASTIAGPRTTLPESGNRQSALGNASQDKTNPTGTPQSAKPQPTAPSTIPANLTPRPTHGDAPLDATSVPSGATLIFDGDSQKTCQTPCRLSLPYGRHTLTARLEGFRPLLRTFILPADAELSLVMEGITGKLMLSSDPAGAEISVDGVIRGEKTPAVLSLKPGEHRLELRKEGFRTRAESIRIEEELKSLQIPLTPE